MRNLLIFFFCLVLAWAITATIAYEQAKDNAASYAAQLKTNNEKRETGYRIRIDALNEAGKILGYRLDSIAARHRNLVRSDSLMTVELHQLKGRFDKLTASELQDKMITEYNVSK